MQWMSLGCRLGCVETEDLKMLQLQCTSLCGMDLGVHHSFGDRKWNHGDTPYQRFDCMAYFGRSTQNTQAERLWVKIGTQFVRRWQAFFTCLEHLHGLDPTQPAHLWLLHFLFLEAINKDCRRFQEEWNSHPISGEETHNKSPKVCQMALKGRKCSLFYS
jgi:hypothetical protein